MCVSPIIFWPFDPAKNAILRWCTGRGWHILMAVMTGNRVNWNWLIKWDELKNSHRTLIDWCTGRETSELHDNYFRLMMIKHSISKIEWASNDYITQLSSTSQLSSSSSSSGVEWRCGRESHTRPKGLGALMNWGPEKMLIRCSKESQHPAEWTPASGEQERHNVDGHNNGVKILQLCSISSYLSHATLE